MAYGRRGHRAGASRWVALLCVVALSTAACSAGAGDVAGSATATDPTTALANAKGGPRESGPSALRDMRDASFPTPLVDPELVLSGGPPPDGIPAIDEPRFQRAGAVTWLGDTEPVLALTLGGETRGYPVQVMTWHEIVNDTVGGIPVAVTYCPLCNSGVAFERTVADRVLTFGTSGRLYADNLVMYDRQTESLWPQLTGQASIGTLTGARLRAVPMGAVGWRDFRAEHPDAWVLSRVTGFDRPYGRNPYTGYDEPGSRPFFELPGPVDERLTAKTRVVGVQRGGDVVAVTRDRLAREQVVELSVGGAPLVLWHRAGQASALDTERIKDGADIGTVAAYDPVVAGRRLHFTADADGFTDHETRSRWTVLGRADDGELAGRQLSAVTHLDTFWFAWVAFHPDTTLLR